MERVLLLLLLGVLRVSAQTFTCCSGQASCGSVTNNPVFCSALGDLYYATNGPTSWTTKTGWSSAAAGTPTSYCSFYQAVGSRCTVAGVLTAL
jgi:hypothetical protein